MIKKTCPNAGTLSATCPGEAALVAELAGLAGTANGALSPIASASIGTNTTPALLRTEIPAFHATRTRFRAVSAQPTPGSISYFARPGGWAVQSFPGAGILQAIGTLGSARTACGCGRLAVLSAAPLADLALDPGQHGLCRAAAADSPRPAIQAG